MCVRGKSLSLAPISLGATLSSGDTFPATPFFMRIREKIFKILFLLCAAFSIIASFIICLFLFMNGIPAIQKIGFIDFIFGLKCILINRFVLLQEKNRDLLALDKRILSKTNFKNLSTTYCSTHCVCSYGHGFYTRCDLCVVYV